MKFTACKRQEDASRMNIVLLESLGVPDQILNACAKPLVDAGHTFQAYPKDTDPQVQIERAKAADVIMIANMPLKGEVISACPELKFIDVAFTGVDHVDLDACRAKGVKVSNAAGYSNQAVAELVICMALSLLRNVPQVEARCRAGQTKDGLVGCELQGKTVGIVGVGAIGRRTAELFHAFGCRVLGNKRHVKGDEPSFIQFVSLDELLAQSDLVSLHCPLNESSKGLIGKENIAKMKQGRAAYQCRPGPGGGLPGPGRRAEQRLSGGAGIDVFEVEPPLSADHPLLHSKNTIVTPHVAFASAESMEERCKIVFDSLQQWIAGRQINVIL